MKWIGLTGGIACGKSTIAQLLRDHSFSVIDADEIAKSVVEPGTPGLKAVLTEFGEDLISEDGLLDRRKLGQKVFGHPERLKKLETLLHPLIRQEVQRQRETLIKQNVKLAIYDIPLLFETKVQDQFDAVIVVSCTLEQQKERLRLRNQWSEEEISERLGAQLPISIKEEEAQFVVRNNRDLSFLKGEFERLMTWLNRESL